MTGRAAGGRRGGGGRDDWWQTPLMLAVLAVVGLALAVWAAGQLTGRIAGDAWPDVPATSALGLLIGLRTTLTDPAAAWPSPTAALLPGPVPFYATLALVCAAPAAAAAGAAAVWRRTADRLAGRGGRAHDPGAAGQLASRRDLRPLHVKGPTKGRLTLGTAHGKLIAAEPRASLAVVGPGGSGKTTSLAIPAILEWDGPVVAASVKRDLERHTALWRATQGDVWYYDPTSATGRPTNTWSPLGMSETWRGAMRAAAALVAAGSTGGVENKSYWESLGRILLAPLLYAAANSGRTMDDVVTWVKTQEENEVRNILGALGAYRPLEEAEASWRREDRAKSSVYGTAETVLEAFSDPLVAASADTCEIDPRRLVDGGRHTLYVSAPSAEQDRLAPLFTTLLAHIVATAFDIVNQRDGRPLDPPLLIVLDEAANIAPLRDLDKLAATMAAQGVQLVTIWQDLAQVKNRYGDRAQTILNNHRGLVALSGIKDPGTLELISTLAGDHELAKRSTTTSASGERSHTESNQREALATKAGLRSIRPHHALVVYGHLSPVPLRMLPWFANRRLRTRAMHHPEEDESRG